MTNEENEDPTGGHVAEVREDSTSVQDSILIDSVVHTSTHHHVHADSSYEELLNGATTMLNTQKRMKAIELLDRARAKRDTLEARFYLAIALLSNRSLRDLREDEEQALLGLARFAGWPADQRWKPALELVCDLAQRHRNGKPGDENLTDRISELEPAQRTLIEDHLRHVLDGETRDRMWAEIRQRARDHRTSNNRHGRVWAYFCAEPAGARARVPQPDATTPDEVLGARLWLAVATMAIGYIGWLTVSTAGLLTTASFLCAAGGAFVGIRCGLDWHYRSRRIAAKDRQYRFDPFKRRADTGFAGEVTHYFDKHFRRSAPSGSEADSYLATIAGIKAYLRDELVEVYREPSIHCSRIRWLIRALAKDTRRRYDDDDLYPHRERYRTPTTVKRWCMIGALTAVAAWIATASQLIPLAPVRAIPAVVVAVAAGTVSVIRWDRILRERRRAIEDRVEYDEEIARREHWREEWRKHIAEVRPTDTEMQKWLDCDLTLLRDEILKNYRLSWKDVTCEATLLSPTGKRRRARVENGQWRYTRYAVHVFLLTKDGVREVTTELDFKDARFGAQSRHNFRFDAVSSIYVESTPNGTHELHLSLMNGDPRPIPVAEATENELRDGENPDRITEMNLEASGFVHTLRLLEGIAAEGKGWLRRASA